MVLDAVSNFVRGTADAEVGTDDTTVSVADASIFPDPAKDGEFNVVIWDVNNFPRPDQDGDVEIMRVTGRDTTADELTVTRGQEMTSAAAHPEDSAIHLSPTAKMFSDIESTFGDFWNAGTQELTADVNNTNTTTTALEAGSVSTDKGNITATEAPFNSGFVEDFRSESFAHYDIRKQDANFDFVESPRINDDSPTLRHNPGSASGDSLLSSVVYGGAGFRYSLVGRFDSTSGPEIDIFTIVADDDNFLRFRFEARNNTAEITENVAGTSTTLASESSLTVNLDEWYTLLSDVGASYAKFDILDEGGTSILSDKLTASITENEGTGFGLRCRSDGNDNTFITHLARRGL